MNQSACPLEDLVQVAVEDASLQFHLGVGILLAQFVNLLLYRRFFDLVLVDFTPSEHLSFCLVHVHDGLLQALVEPFCSFLLGGLVLL